MNTALYVATVAINTALSVATVATNKANLNNFKYFICFLFKNGSEYEEKLIFLFH